MKYAMRLLLIGVLLTLCSGALAEEFSADERAVRDSLAAFVKAFNNLEWEAFESSFTDDATIFLFTVPERSRLDETFAPLFKRVRETRTGPPFLDISPKDLRIEVSGDWAIATFHLRDMPRGPEGEIHSRTLVLERQDRAWKIRHLHASVWRPSEAPTR